MTATAQRGSVELRLVVRSVGETTDAVVQVEPNVPVRELADALAHGLGLPPGPLRHDGAELPPDAPLSELMLRWGDELGLGVEHGRDPVTSLELVVHGGPEAGRRIPLFPGTYRLGRDGDLTLDDPSLSAHHVVLHCRPEGSVSVTDAGSRNGTAVDGTRLAPDEEHDLSEDELVHAGRSLFALERASGPRQPLGAGESGVLSHNRPPRVRRPLESTRWPVQAPPDDPQRARLPLGASLIPLALGVGLYLLTHLPTMLFFSLLSPVMAVTTYLEDRRSGRKGFEGRKRAYRESLVRLQSQLEDERRSELRERRLRSPSAPELLARARNLEPSLWERRPGDADFLELRVGSADLPSLLQLEVQPGGSAQLRDEAEKLAEWHATVPAVPATVPVADAGVVGICGPRERTAGLARWLLAQAATLHSPHELVIAAGVEDATDWDWLKWLPHAEADGPPAPRLGAGLAGTRAVVEELGRLVSGRRRDGDALGGGAQRRLPHVLLLLEEAVAPERALLADVLGAGADLGVTVVWLARERRDLPGECGAILELDESSARLRVTSTADGRELDDVSGDSLSRELARELALALAPIRDAGFGGPGSVPERVSLLELFATDELDASWVAARWSQPRDGLGAPLGAAADGPFRVDLREDGPHGLVAGMTGSGKSELLQTLIASLAANHPPTRLAFLLVDYKGGAAFKDCVRLPHTVGLVTDLDAHLTQRALQSLNAELQRREQLLRAADAKDLADLERRTAEAPPSLLIVIDEFATLANEVPDFVAGIVDVAQRGRSLGVHLLLATQRPGGVVSENIRTNTNLRIALRVNEPAESSDVIGAPDAARIPRNRPGRAFARTGHGELTEIQAAYVGGVSIRTSATEPVVVTRFLLGATPGRSAPAGEGDATDLSRLVDATSAAAAHLGLATPPSPWLPPLDASLPLGAVDQPASGSLAAVGVIDEPARQLQRPLLVDLAADGSILVYGTGGSGKTTFLRTLALALATRLAPGELHVYGLDFATRGLAPLEALPHTGAVIGSEDEERVERLFAFLRRTVERRKLLFSQAGAFTLDEYRGLAGAQPLPRILILLDGYAAFAGAFERVNLGELVDAVPRLVADGRPLGIHFAIAADRRGAVPNTLAGIVPAKLVLRMADEDEFAALGVPPKSVRGAHLPPGRGFLPGGVEFQVAQLEGGAGALTGLGDELRSRHGDAQAPPVEPLPTILARTALPEGERPWIAVAGLADAELDPAVVDLADRHFLVVGPYRSGRSTALRTLVESLHATTPDAELHLLAPRRSPLVELDLWTSVAQGEACDDAAIRIAEELAHDTGRSAVIVVDDGEELAESLGAPSLETLVRRGRDLQLRVVAAAERQAAQRAFGGWLRELRKEEHGLLLDPDPDTDGDILGTRLPRRSNPVFPPGRGYLVERGSVELVQVAM